MKKLIFELGDRIIFIVTSFGEILTLTLNCVKKLPHFWCYRDKVWDAMERFGWRTLPLVLIVSAFGGAVSAWQAAYQFGNIIPVRFIGGATGMAILMEMAPVLTGLVVVGRNGTALSTEIGSMKVTEQIDALKTMNISLIDYLIFPHFFAAIIMLPVLTIFADFAAMIGACIVSSHFFDVSPSQFYYTFEEFFEWRNLNGGLLKSVMFGWTTVIISGWVGLSTQDGARGVGKAATKSFVLGAAVVLIDDFFIASIIF